MREIIKELRWRMKSAESSYSYNSMDISVDSFIEIRELLNFAERMYNEFVKMMKE